MAARCTKHTFDVAVAQCRSCGEGFCGDCLVYTHGPSSPPFCVPCALVAAGVRRVSGAEKKAMKAARGRRIEIDPTAGSQITMTVGFDGGAVDAPATVPASPEVAEAEAGAHAEGMSSRVPLAWVAIVVGLVLLVVPFVAGNV
jgi:hypothetical protein